MLKYYFKNALFMFVFLLTCSILSLVVTLIDNTTVKFLLSLVSVAFFFLEMFAYCDYLGRDAERLKNSNAQALKAMLATGREIKIQTYGEFAWYKALIIASITCCIPVIFSLIQLIVTACGSNNIALLNIIKVMFAVFYAPQNSFSTDISVYYTLLYIPFAIGFAELGYFVGKSKIDAEQKQIQQIKNKINGISEDDE